MSGVEVSAHMPAAPIFLPEGPWKQVDLLHDAVFVLLFAFFCAISFSCFFNIDQDCDFIRRFPAELQLLKDSKLPDYLAVFVPKATSLISRLSLVMLMPLLLVSN